jgi:nucleoside-diphosphate-sugar epimerase
VLTEWQPYRTPDFARIRERLSEPVVFDGRNLWEPEKMEERGSSTTRSGRAPARQPSRGGRPDARPHHRRGRLPGLHLCDRFLAEGHTVVGMDNFITGHPDNIAHLIGNERFRFVEHDVTNFIYVEGPLDGVLHFASPASPVDYLEKPIPTLKVGSLGTHNALGLAKAKGARFLLASTSEVYGDPQVHPQPESYWGHVNPVGPRGVYDEAKRFAEAMTMAYHRYHGWRRASCASSTPTGRGCAPATAGW